MVSNYKCQKLNQMIGGITNKLVAIEITNNEAKLFLLFRKYQDEFSYLLDEGFFDFVGEAKVFRDGNKILKGVSIPKMRKKGERY